MADILLITNHSTTPEELAAWKSAAAVVNQSINVWDISLNDSLSLSEKLVHGQNLLRDFHGKTIVVNEARPRKDQGGPRRDSRGGGGFRGGPGRMGGGGGGRRY